MFFSVLIITTVYKIKSCAFGILAHLAGLKPVLGPTTDTRKRSNGAITQFRPADILLQSRSFLNHDLCVDVTVSSPISATGTLPSGFTPGAKPLLQKEIRICFIRSCASKFS